jgi:hypothetical protein
MNIHTSPAVRKVSNAVTFDSMHTVTLSVHDWMAIECAMAQGRLNSLDHGWTETAKLQSELLDRLDAQVREQIDGAGEADEETA